MEEESLGMGGGLSDTVSKEKYSCSILSDAEEEEYRSFLGSASGAVFEHTCSWKRILEKNFGFVGYYVIARDENSAICGVLPLFLAKGFYGYRLVCTPYAVYTGALARNEECLHQLAHRAVNLCCEKSCDFVEIREQSVRKYPTSYVTGTSVFNFSLKLSEKSSEVLAKLPKGSVRWGIKKAKASHLSVSVGRDNEDIDTFYSLFLATRKFRGVPAYPYRYYRDIVAEFGEKVRIYTAWYGERAVASIFLIYYGKEVRYAFAGCVHDSALLQMQPYHLLIWQAIEDACKEGYEVFNFGGAMQDTNDGGLYEFKKRWSDTVIAVPFYYYLHNINTIPAVKGGVLFDVAGKVWKRMPLSLIKFLSPRIIKRFV